MARARNPPPPPSTPSATTSGGPTSPTEEQRGFVAADEAAPPSMLYPRDPSLDPPTRRQGKDEQDRRRAGCAGRAGLYSGEIDPEAIIEDFVNQARRAGE